MGAEGAKHNSQTGGDGSEAEKGFAHAVFLD
jgi:hypothetical protein